MPTNEERRKVAQKLRNSDIERHQLNPMVSHATVTICGSSIVCIDEESLRMALDYLADLIDPELTVDRDALLALARDLEVSIMESGVCGDVAVLVLNIVKQIREACGEAK